MLAAIAGDVIGSIYEVTLWSGRSYEDAVCCGYEYAKEEQFPVGEWATEFPLFRRGVFATDDSVLTAAVMEWLLHGGSLEELLKKWFGFYPVAGYGSKFWQWAMSDESYHPESVGNGAAMRVSPVAWAFESEREVLEFAKLQAEVTHLGDGVSGAQAVALGIYLARSGVSRADIQQELSGRFGYDLSRPLDLARRLTVERHYSCLAADTIPWAIRAFLEGNEYEDTVRRMISIGGDTDTNACMAGALAAAKWGFPERIRIGTIEKLDSRMQAIVSEFEARFPASACR